MILFDTYLLPSSQTEAEKLVVITDESEYLYSFREFTQSLEKAHQSTLEEREIHKAWIFSKHQQLKQVSDTIEASITVG